MSADPRRLEKVQRYVPKNNANGEDLTPDYMNIMGQPPTTANASGEPVEKHPDPALEVRPEDVQQANDERTATSSNAANVIPTSPQYGVAIIPNNSATVANDLSTESVTVPTDTVTDSTIKTVDDIKDIHTTPSRNDRFKVVKIASLEPFKRGRWKCMDYVDEAPPANIVNSSNPTNKGPQSVGNAGGVTAGVYFQTQSLPQQQIQQMLLQGGFTNGTQFFPTVPAQIIPQGQYFYPQVANVQNQTVTQPVATSIPAQFISNQPYFTAGVVTNPAGFTLPQNYQNIQYVPIPAQNSAFVPTSQPIHLPNSFQQSQTYAGQAAVSQANVSQNLMNGHAYTEAQITNSNMPNQPAKNVILNSQPVNTQPQPNNAQSQSAQSVVQNQQYQQPQGGSYQPSSTTQPAQTQNSTQSSGNVIGVAQSAAQNFDASNVYTNPQFAMSVNSLTVLDSSDNNPEVKETNSAVETSGENTEDPSKSNPVVNAIDNKIEQAMDLVKSHLMYTVREEVEVLKEKIADLMERIQQLETENNFLKSQIPKGQTTAPPPTSANTTFSNSVTQPAPAKVAVVNPSPSVLPQQNSNPVVSSTNVPQVGAPASNATPSQNQTIPNSSNIHPAAQETPATIQ